MVNFLLNSCFIISWIAIPTLAFFTWIAHKEPELLEIKKEHQSKGKQVLIISTVIYFFLAIVLTILKEFGSRKRRKIKEEEGNLIAQGNFRGGDSISLEDVVDRKREVKNVSHLTGMSFDSRGS